MTTTEDTTDLTPRQRELLTFLVTELTGGRIPTIRSMGRHLGIGSPNGVVCHLRALQTKGYLEWRVSRTRGVVLTTKASAGEVNVERRGDSRVRVRVGLLVLDLTAAQADEVRRQLEDVRHA